MRLLRLARQACAVQNTSNCSAVILLHVQYSESVCSSARTGYVFFGTLVAVEVAHIDGANYASVCTCQRHKLVGLCVCV